MNDTNEKVGWHQTVEILYPLMNDLMINLQESGSQ